MKAAFGIGRVTEGLAMAAINPMELLTNSLGENRRVAILQ